MSIEHSKNKQIVILSIIYNNNSSDLYNPFPFFCKYKTNLLNTLFPKKRMNTKYFCKYIKK